MEKKKNRKKKIITAVIIIAVIVGIGAGITSCASNMLSSVTEVIAQNDETLSIQKQNLIRSISVSGTVQSGSLVKVTSMTNAKIQTLNVKIGDYVNEGDILCIFDSSDIQKEYDSIQESINKTDEMNQHTHEINQRNLNDAIADKEIALNQAQRNIDDAKTACQNAYDKYNSLNDKCYEYLNKVNELYDSLDYIEDELEYQDVYQQYEQYSQLYESTIAERDAIDEQLSTYDSAVQSAYDAYKTAEKNADSAIQSMQDTINAEKFNSDSSSQTQLEKLAQQLEECTVKAEKSGIITSLNVAEGSIPTTDALMTIEDASSLKINVQIKEADILNVKEGLKAVIKTDATGDTEINGTVSRVVNILSGDDSQQTGGYTAEISIDDTDNELLIGMSAKVKIILEEKDDVLAVPYDSITKNKNGRDIIYIAEKQNDGTYKAKSVEIEKGMESDYYTEIISSDVKENDLILLSPELVYNGKSLIIADDSEIISETSDGEQ
jgi:HlyD family secretion protein